MNKTDYINIQAPMIADLNLSGKNELLIFALIHGYTKDGKSACRVSQKNMAEWLKTSKSAVIRTLKDLEEAGYINRREYREKNVKKVEYTTNYEALLERAANGEYISLDTAKKSRGLKMRPTTERAQIRGSQNETGLKMITRGSQNETERGLKMRPNNNIIINYNNFYCASPAEQEEEKKNFYEDFIFRNAADPAAEVERFIAYNDTLEWRNKEGRCYDTPEKRLGLARLWSFKSEGQWARPDYLKAVEGIVKAARKEMVEGVEALIDQRVKLEWCGSQNKWIWSVTAGAQQWIMANSPLVHRHLDGVIKTATVSWNLIRS